MTSIFTIYSDLCKLSAPAHWRVRRFKDVITSSRSGIWGDDEKGNSDDIVCYRVADFDYSNLCLKFDNITYRNVLREQVDEKSLSAGDLLLEKSGGGEKMPVGRVVLVNSSQRAVCSNFIQALSVNKEYSARFVLYLFYSIYSNRINTLFFNQTTGIQNLKTSHYLAQEIILPPYPEQEAIAAYLDKECDKIRRKIELLERKADAYTRLRRAIINRAVTRGLNPDVPLKPSSLPFDVEIPSHWNVKRIKSLFEERNEYSQTGEEDLLSVSEYYGVAKRRDKIDGDNISRSDFLEGYKLCYIDDIVSNIMLAWKGSLGTTTYNGIVSPAYGVYKPIYDLNSRYYHYLFRTELYKTIFKNNSRGIIDSRLRLYTPNFLALKAFYPPLSEQDEIVVYLDEKCAKIDAIVEKINSQIERLKELKRSLINEVVTGKRAINTIQSC